MENFEAREKALREAIEQRSLIKSRCYATLYGREDAEGFEVLMARMRELGDFIIKERRELYGVSEMDFAWVTPIILDALEDLTDD